MFQKFANICCMLWHWKHTLAWSHLLISLEFNLTWIAFTNGVSKMKFYSISKSARWCPSHGGVIWLNIKWFHPILLGVVLHFETHIDMILVRSSECWDSLGGSVLNSWVPIAGCLIFLTYSFHNGILLYHLDPFLLHS